MAKRIDDMDSLNVEIKKSLIHVSEVFLYSRYR